MLFDHIAGAREVSKIRGSQRFSTARGACGKIPRNGAALAACRGGQPRSRDLTHHGRRAMYQSDITQFLNQLKQQKPYLEAEQRKGRALLWDKQPIDLEERAEQTASRVEQTSYSYYQNF
jgi:hypothetical protein